METNEIIKNVLRAFYYQNYSHRACLNKAYSIGFNGDLVWVFNPWRVYDFSNPKNIPLSTTLFFMTCREENLHLALHICCDALSDGIPSYTWELSNEFVMQMRRLL
jgi:hypothetical protein